MPAFWFAALAAYLLVLAAQFGLAFLNLAHLRREGANLPPAFAGQIDPERLGRAQAYAAEKIRFGFVSSGVNAAGALIFFFGGWLGVYAAWIRAWGLSFIPSGLAFFLILGWAGSALNLPLDWYRTFRLEHRYGFNTQSFVAWVSDGVKSWLLGTAMAAALAGAGLWLVRSFPHTWWLWFWAVFMAFNLILLVLSPAVLEPLFNTFTPLGDASLADDLRGLAAKAGIRVERVVEMDASRRSRHSNAYFSGIGRVKRIVLFDTLLPNLARGEILAVVAHEAGHWRLHHIRQRLLLTGAGSLAILAAAYGLLRAGLPGAWFRLPAADFFAQAALLGFLLSWLAFPLLPVFNGWSRHQERRADRFACALTGDPAALAGALIKLAKDNLVNLHPHPWTAAFYYSHPPVVQRVAGLLAQGRT